MANFGTTLHGAQWPIRHCLRPDYREPEVPPPPASIPGLPRTIDMYLGVADGFAYRSQDRARRLRKKKFWKPIGPLDTYRTPPLTSMDIGWALCDDALEHASWATTARTAPLSSCDVTRYVKGAMEHDKMFFWRPK